MGGVGRGSFKALSRNLAALVLAAYLGQAGIPGEERYKVRHTLPTPHKTIKKGRESAVEATAVGAARQWAVSVKPFSIIQSLAPPRA